MFPLFVAAASAAVVDRVAVVVGTEAITESEVLQELRLSEFMDGRPLDLGPEARRAAAERLVDQLLIRNEMKIGSYPKPTAEETVAMLKEFRQEHYPGVAQFREALARYGIAEDELKNYLNWQLTVMRFTDIRFRPGPPGPPVQTANRLRAGAVPSNDTVDQQMDAWLSEARAGTRIQFKKGAFQ
jgi:hypothetical protein